MAIREQSLVGGPRVFVKAIAQREEYYVAGPWLCQLWRADFAQTVRRRHRASAGHSYLAMVTICTDFVVGRTRDGSPILGPRKKSQSPPVQLAKRHFPVRGQCPQERLVLSRRLR